jgi:adenylate cyclase
LGVEFTDHPEASPLATEHVERRLAAVLAADVAGYSRLMGNDEEGTLARLKFLRKTLIDPAIASHRGRIVKTTGDGVLVEFASAVDAARSSAEVQRRMAEQNAAWPQEQRIQFRIGIHVGDIIIDDNDIFGDGVNIAARLEGIAEPGGVCISDDAHRQIRGKVDVTFDDMGEQNLKNIVEPMRAWQLRLAGHAAPAIRPSLPPTPDLKLPDKPSIVVLPFDNMSAEAARTISPMESLKRLRQHFPASARFSSSHVVQPLPIRGARQTRAISAGNWALPIRWREVCKKSEIAFALSFS